jgi:hypothetical protein
MALAAGVSLGATRAEYVDYPSFFVPTAGIVHQTANVNEGVPHWRSLVFIVVR